MRIGRLRSVDGALVSVLCVRWVVVEPLLVLPDVSVLEVVEVSPPYDISDITALLAARAMVDVLATMTRNGRVGGRLIPAPHVEEVDATGAGDALAAAFCVSYLDGATPVEAAEKAVVVASGAVTRAGGRPS